MKNFFKIPFDAERNGKIESFEIVTLRTSGMRITAEYEMVMKDGKAEISEYWIMYEEGEDRRVLERRAVCSEAEALKLLNDCHILSWDGFNGPHPRGVLDGTMFKLEATVNGGKIIRARGSQNFPQHYWDFNDALYEILSAEKSEQ